MTTGQVVVLTLASPFIIWIAARLIFVAYFRSKSESQRTENHG